jgi:hypothetical protein
MWLPVIIFASVLASPLTVNESQDTDLHARWGRPPNVESYTTQDYPAEWLAATSVGRRGWLLDFWREFIADYKQYLATRGASHCLVCKFNASMRITKVSLLPGKLLPSVSAVLPCLLPMVPMLQPAFTTLRGNRKLIKATVAIIDSGVTASKTVQQMSESTNLLAL